MSLSVFIITLNEEESIGSCLDALHWADEIVVVDSGSTDHTMEICRSKKASVYQRPFDNYAAQKNYALSMTHHEWVLSIDADEIVSQPLSESIKQIIDQKAGDTACTFQRQNFFLGKPFRFSSPGNDWVLRLFPKTKGKFEGVVHETVQLAPGVKTKPLKGLLIHHGTENLKEYFIKLRHYTDLEAVRLNAENRVPDPITSVLKPLAKFCLDYIFLGGFLDGVLGLTYHGLSCWYGWVKNFKAIRFKNSKKK